MDIKKICFVYFSPTGTTKKIIDLIKAKLNYSATRQINLTYPDYDSNLSFLEDELVLFCYPVYSGRVPETMKERLKTMSGKNTPCAIVCSYGSRRYDDAIMEMKDMTESRGFITIGAMAVVTEHSVITSVGTGRPDINDRNVIDVFSKELREKLLSIPDITHYSGVYVPGNHRYRHYMHIPMVPVTLNTCKKCGACVKTCPTDAISLKDKIYTDKSRCICCMKCVRVCPEGARILSSSKKALGKFYLSLTSTHKMSEIFM